MHRDLEEDIAAFESAQPGPIEGIEPLPPQLPFAPAVPEAADLTPEHAHAGELEALAAGASLSDLTRMIPKTVTQPMSAHPAASGALSAADVDRIARRVVEIIGDKVVREVAWDLVPEMAERLVRTRIQELERAT
jgi:hypothetical protein